MRSKDEAFAETEEAQAQIEREIDEQKLHRLPEFSVAKIDEAMAALRQADAGTAGFRLGELRQAIIEQAKELGYGK